MLGKSGSIMLDRYSHGTGEYAKGIPEKVDCGEFWKYKANSWAHIFGDHFNNSGNTNPYDPTSIFPQAFWYLSGKNPVKGRTHIWYSDDRTLTLITNIGTEDGTGKIITSSIIME